MKKVILLTLLIVFSVRSYSQVELESQNDNTSISNIKLIPSFEFGKGIGVTTADSTFNLRFRFRMQSRATVFSYGDESELAAEVRRMRLRFDGFVYSPKLQYKIQLSFTHGDMHNPVEDGMVNIIRDAIIAYKPNRNFEFIFGQTKLPGNRQRLNSSGNLELTDRTLNNALFTIDRDFGVQAKNYGNIGNKSKYIVSAAISTGEGRGWTGLQEPTNLAYTGKLELYPFGQFKGNGAYFEGDVLREESPRLMISSAYSYNKGTNKVRGQLGDLMPETRDIKSTFVDAIFKYNGWGASAAYMIKNCDNPIVSGTDAFNNDYFYTVPTGNGTDVQVSYTTKTKWAFITRFSHQNLSQELNNNLKADLPDQNDYSIGITKYLQNHTIKLQTEFLYSDIKHSAGGDNLWYLRFQVEVGI